MEIEAYLLSNLRAFGLPDMKTYGYNSQYNILIMELLGQSLENLFQKQKKRFSLKTACMLGIQMIDRVEYIHSRKILHRDMKPDNFVMGRGDKSHIVYLIDFGLSKKYWSSRLNKHIPYSTNKKLTGTARYASINALSGCEQGRRDDLESIGYIIMYFIRGSLPWQGLKINNKEDRYKKICDKKKSTSARELCAGYPKEFQDFVSYTRKLKFQEVPDYEYLKNLLRAVIKNEGEVIDFKYDWCHSKPHIKANDIIYTNNYGIIYDGEDIWLNRKYCLGEIPEPINNNIISISSNGNMTNLVYIKKNHMAEESMPKPIKDDNTHDDEININFTHQQNVTELNSLAPQFSSSNILNNHNYNKDI